MNYFIIVLNNLGDNDQSDEVPSGIYIHNFKITWFVFAACVHIIWGL